MDKQDVVKTDKSQRQQLSTKVKLQYSQCRFIMASLKPSKAMQCLEIHYISDKVRDNPQSERSDQPLSTG